MRRLVADVRFGLSGLLSSPGTTGPSAAWLLAGLLLGGGLAHWLDAPLRSSEAAAPAGPGLPRVRVEAVFSTEPAAIGRLRCLAGHSRCALPPETLPPCRVPSPSLQS